MSCDMIERSSVMLEFSLKAPRAPRIKPVPTINLSKIPLLLLPPPVLRGKIENVKKGEKRGEKGEVYEKSRLKFYLKLRH